MWWRRSYWDSRRYDEDRSRNEQPRLLRIGNEKQVILSDRLVREKFEELRPQVGKLQELEEKGKETYQIFPELLLDMFSALYYADPMLRRTHQIRPSHRLNLSIMQKLLETEEYQQLHTFWGDELVATTGVVALGEAVLKIIAEDDEINDKIDQLQQQENQALDQQNKVDRQQDDLNQSQQDLDDLQWQQQQLQQQAQSAIDQGDQAQAQQLNQQAQAMNGQIQQQQQQVSQKQAAVGQAQMTLEQAKEKLKQMLSDFMDNNIQPKAKEIRQAMRTAARQGTEDASEMYDMLEAWGMEPGQVMNMGYEQKLALAERIKKSEKMIQFSKFLGRAKALALGHVKEMIDAGVKIISEYTLGRDLSKVIKSEFRDLAHPLFQKQFMLKFAHGRLVQRRTRTERKVGKGPRIHMHDVSGSMESGGKYIFAGGIDCALAVASIAEKRSYATILFDARNAAMQVVEFRKTNGVIKACIYKVDYKDGSLVEVSGSRKDMDVMDAQFFLAEYERSGGGTDFEKPISWAMKLAKEEGFDGADLCLTTDGECTVTGEFLSKLKQFKSKTKSRLVSVQINVGSSSKATLEEVSDEVHLVTDLSEEKADEIFKSM